MFMTKSMMNHERVDFQVISSTTKGEERVIVSSSSPDQVLKAVQSSPGGLREVSFYEKISTSSDPELQQWRDLAPKFHGLKNVTKEDGTTSQYMILGN